MVYMSLPHCSFLSDVLCLLKCCWISNAFRLSAGCGEAGCQILKSMAMNMDLETKLLEKEAGFFIGEKEPENKYDLEAQAPIVCTILAAPPEDGVVMGEPVPELRQPWSTGLFCCLGSNDEFCGTDLEVSVLGCFAPCVLYGSNVERLHPGQCAFGSHCMGYSTMYMMGHFLFSGNFLAPFVSFPSRTALRRQHNLEGCSDQILQSALCCSGRYQFRSEEKREQCEFVFDFATHFCCHPCALCQEGREIRRRTVHPAHRSMYTSLAAPTWQSME